MTAEKGLQLIEEKEQRKRGGVPHHNGSAVSANCPATTGENVLELGNLMDLQFRIRFM